MKHKTTYLDNEILYQVLELIYSEIDELIHELAPEGWNNSIYHFPFERIEHERETLYRTYEIVGQAFEQRFGYCLRQYLQETTKMVDVLLQPSIYNSSQGEITYLIEFALVQLTKQGLVFKTSDPAYYYIMDEFDIGEQSYILSKSLGLVDATMPNVPLLSPARNELLYYLDLSALYAAILKTFRHFNYDWRYRNEELECRWLRWQIAHTMNRNNGNNSQQKLWQELNESIASVTRAQPPDEVMAYISTNERLPIGYPPTIADIEYITSII